MEEIYFTPGPGQLYPTVPKHMTELLEAGLASHSHRSEHFHQAHRGAVEAVKALLHIPHEWSVYFVGSATEAMERSLQNNVLASSLHYVYGAFSDRYHKIAQSLGLKTEVVCGEHNCGVQKEQLHIAGNPDFIAVTLSETSTGLWMPEGHLRAIRACYPDAIVMVDMVSAAPYSRVDSEVMDGAFFSVQKGFGLPAGLGVLAVSPRCLEKAQEVEKKGQYTGSYHSYAQLEASYLKNQTPATPNVIAIELLRRVTLDLLARKHHQLVAAADAHMERLFALCGDKISPFVKEESWRSRTVAVLVCEEAQALRNYCAERGVYLGGGYGPYKKEHIRVAAFPAHTEEQFARLEELLVEAAGK